MKGCGRFLTSCGFVFIALLLGIVPASAQSEEIEEQIKALEKEVAKIEPLKEQIERLRSHQIELRKEATAAAAALPTFEFRAGRGLSIVAADKSWGWNMSYRLDNFMYFYPGSKSVIETTPGPASAFARTRRNDGHLHVARNRFYLTFFTMDGFFETRFTLDGEGAIDTDRRLAQARDSSVIFHFEQFNPFFPSFVVGARVENEIYLGRSSSSDVKTEHNWSCDSISTTCTGSSSSIGLQWEEVPIGPGDLTYHAMMHTRGVGITHDEERDTTRKGFSTCLLYQPFSKIKSKWIEGLELGLGYHMHSIDKRADPLGAEPNELDVQTHEDRGSVRLIQTQQGIGGGPLQFISPGIKWRVGPYQLRSIWGKGFFKGRSDNFRGVSITSWEVAHQIFLWSPKGPLTGSYTIPGSVHAGFTFERGDARCAKSLADLVAAGGDCAQNQGNFNSNAFFNREAGIFVAITPGMRAGYAWSWWKSANTPVRTQVAMGCRKNIDDAIAGRGAGRECEWSTHTLLLQTRW